MSRADETPNGRTPISFIATSDPKAAKVFYGEVLGLELVEATPFALVFADGTNVLRVQIVDALQPAQHTVHGWRVSDIVAQIEDLSAKGVGFLKFDQLTQDASGVWQTPDGSQIAWFSDPSGNVLSLTQYASP